ncbi:hypothetical protein C0993_002008 [Termitomyces sp. T159_Od127]|nr:hypothetical protein C0993_002008 [Termitomyces sp. T159_Od127]
MVKEVEGKVVPMASLLAGSPAILMMEKEFQETLETGEQPGMAGRKETRKLELDKISKPSEIDFDGVLLRRPHQASQPIVRLNIADASQAQLRALQDRFEPKVQLHTKHVEKGKAKAQGLTEEDILRLRQQWQRKYADIVNGTKEELPPWREVNHEINLIDNHKQYKYHLPHCPQGLQDQLWKKANSYINAKWWEAQSAVQAAPLLCIPKA